MKDIFEHIFISTEDEEIKDIAKRYGVPVIDRPHFLCGDVPDIAVYKHAFEKKLVGGFVAVHADTPLVSEDIILQAKTLIEAGVEEVCTVHPFDYGDDYKKQAARIYGSVRGMSLNRLNHYEDPYRPRPEVLLVDPSPEIETREDYDKVRCLMSLLS